MIDVARPTDRCIYCSGEGRGYLNHAEVGVFLQCRNCGLIFQPSDQFKDEAELDGESVLPEDFKAVYSEFVDTSDEQGNMYASFGIDHAGMEDGLFQEVREVITECGFGVDSEFRVLDVGCATGFLLAKVREAFPNAIVQGIEPSPVSTAKARTLYGLAIHNGTVQNFDQNGHQFDVVMIMGNLQLHADPFSTLARVHGLMKPGGRLVFQMKNPERLARRIGRLASRIPVVRRLSLTRSILYNGFLCMRYSAPRDFYESAVRQLGFDEIRVTTQPPRMLAYSNRNVAHAQGIKGRVWALMDRIDARRNQRAWIKVVCRKPEVTS